MVTHLSRTIPNGSLEELLADVAVHVHSLVLYDIIIDIHLEVALVINKGMNFIPSMQLPDRLLLDRHRSLGQQHRHLQEERRGHFGKPSCW